MQLETCAYCKHMFQIVTIKDYEKVNWKWLRKFARTAGDS